MIQGFSTQKLDLQNRTKNTMKYRKQKNKRDVTTRLNIQFELST